MCLRLFQCNCHHCIHIVPPLGRVLSLQARDEPTKTLARAAGPSVWCAPGDGRGGAPSTPCAGAVEVSRPAAVMVGVASVGAYDGRTPSCHSRTYSAPLVQVPGVPTFSGTMRQRFLAAFSISSACTPFCHDFRAFSSSSNIRSTIDGPNCMPLCSASNSATWEAT